MARPVHLLHVEDDAHAGEAFARRVHQLQPTWKVLTARHATMALRLLQAWDVEVVVADIALGGMSGIELLERVASLYPHILRVVLSGTIDAPALLGTRQWAQLHMCKPCRVEELVAAVQETVRRRDEMRRTTAP